MTVKYHCRKCGKRYVDWGAEKLGFKCPECEGEELVRVGGAEEKPVKRPALKRKPRKVSPVIAAEEEVLAPDLEEGEEEEELEPDEKIFVSTGVALDDSVSEVVDFDLEEAVVPADTEDAEDADMDLTEDLDFSEATPTLEDEPIEGHIEETDEWPA